MKHSLPISDELLSAYIDQQVSEAERQRVEMALAAEPALQQKLDDLRAAVSLLNQTPSLVVPRAFVLSENQVLAAGGRVKGVKKPSFWEQWLPRLMPVATAFIAILFVFSFAYTPQEQGELPVTTMARETAAAPMARSMAAEESAPRARGAVEEKAGPAAASVEQNGAAASMTTETAEDQAEEPEAAVVATGANAEEAQAATAAEAGAAAAAETAPVESAETTAAAPPEVESYSPRFSWVTWLLGLLLVLFIFLTWQLTLGRPREE
jgi:hypothetical protein